MWTERQGASQAGTHSWCVSITQPVMEDGPGLASHTGAFPVPPPKELHISRLTPVVESGVEHGGDTLGQVFTCYSRCDLEDRSVCARETPPAGCLPDTLKPWFEDP